VRKVDEATGEEEVDNDLKGVVEHINEISGTLEPVWVLTVKVGVEVIVLGVLEIEVSNELLGGVLHGPGGEEGTHGEEESEGNEVEVLLHGIITLLGGIPHFVEGHGGVKRNTGNEGTESEVKSNPDVFRKTKEVSEPGLTTVVDEECTDVSG